MMGDFIIGSRTQDQHTHTPVVRLHVQERRQQKENSSERRQIPKASRPFLDFAQFKIRFLSLLLRLFSILTHFFGCTFSKWINELFSLNEQFSRFEIRFSAGLFLALEICARKSPGVSQEPPHEKQIVEFSRAHTHFRLLLINEHDEFDYVFQPDPPAPAVAASEFYSQTTLHAHKKQPKNIQQQCQMEILLLLLLLLFLFQAFLFFQLWRTDRPAIIKRPLNHRCVFFFDILFKRVCQLFVCVYMPG